MKGIFYAVGGIVILLIYRKRKRRDYILNKITKTLVLSALSAITAFGSMAVNGPGVTGASAADLSDWAISEYQAANEAGLCSYAVVSNSMTDNITRQEFCELAVNLYKKLTNDTNMIVPQQSPFSDTDNVAVSQAYCYGLVSGTGDDTFTPNRLVTREEMAKMLVSTLTASEASFDLSDGSDSYIIDSFSDGSKVSEWAKTSVITTLKYSLMNGVTSESFAPSGATTREQAIASINRSYEKFRESAGYILALPQIVLPTDNAEIEEGTFEIAWTTTPGAEKYVYVIKDSEGDAVERYETTGASATIDSKKMKGGNYYSVMVGAILSDGSECYSVPVDFKYKAFQRTTATEKKYLANNPKAQALLDTAAQYLGVPYVWGGTTPSGFDCSGFVQYVCKQNGISIARVADDQLHKSGYSVTKNQLQPGDLVFFGSGDYATHVGMYVGDGMMIHAPSTGKNIMYTSIESDYYKSRYIGARRVSE